MCALPFALALVLLAFRRLDYLLLAIVFFTPLSLPLREMAPGLSFDMNLPTEPLLFGILLFFILNVVRQKQLDRSFLTHPVSLAIGFYLFWMLFTGLTGTMPFISLKYWISKMWFVVPFYVLGFMVLQCRANRYRLVALYGIGFLPVIAYTWWRQSAYGFFDQHASNFVMNPFFKDHTSYGAMLVFFMPAFALLAVQTKRPAAMRLFSLFMFVVFSVALVFSYTRAAWLSLMVVVAVGMLLLLKVRFRTVVAGTLVLAALLLLFQKQLINRIEKNKQQSSSQFSAHLNSISNISTDASNVERMNRWNCALAMFLEKPLLGWGPGTYMFQYAPFQKTDLRTIISTNSGDGGNAHSEYLGPLAESGLPGLLSMLALLVAVIRTGIRVYSRSAGDEKALALAALLGLISYFVHGFLNNFLDTDKAAVPFWAFIALLVVLDLRPAETPAAREP